MSYVAYINNNFPALSATFINKEVAGLRERGLLLQTYSIRKPKISDLSDKSIRLFLLTRYILPLNIPYFFASHVYYMIFHPLKYIKMLHLILTKKLEKGFKDRMRSIIHFCEGVVFAKMLRDHGEIVHIHAHYVSHPATLAMVASYLTNYPFSFTAHASDIWVDKLFIPEKVTACKFAITCTKYGKARLLESSFGLGENKIIVNYHGVNIGMFHSHRDQRKPKNRYTILNIGRLSSEKAQKDLIQACKILIDKGYDLQCIIVGDGPLYSELCRLVDKLNLKNVVQLVGKVFHEDIKKYYLDADIFALPSIRDNLPNVLLESLSIGVPVVASNIAGIPELIKNHVSGILVQPGNVLELVQAIASLFDNKEFAEKISSRGQRKVKRFFDERRCLDTLLEIFVENISHEIVE